MHIVVVDDAKVRTDKAEYRAWLALHPTGTFEEFYQDKHGSKS